MRTVLIAIIIMLMSPSAFGYLDPGAGSIVLQIILGGLAGLGVAWKLFWHRLRGRGSVDVSADDAE